MAVVDYQARGEKESQAILRTVLKKLKSARAHLGHFETSQLEPRKWMVIIETDLTDFAKDELVDAVRRSPNAKLLKAEKHEGSFDWAADTYIKDAASATFSF